MKLVVLDRDGVINQDREDHVKMPCEWVPIPGSLEAIAKLNKHGYTVVVFTNQSGIARDKLTIDTLHCINNIMMQAAEAVGGKIDSVFFCPHDDTDHCYCRKPKPGMLFDIELKYGISLKGCLVVGDRPTDIMAARSVGAEPVFVRTGWCDKTDATLAPVYNNLWEVVEEYTKEK